MANDTAPPEQNLPGKGPTVSAGAPGGPPRPDSEVGSRIGSYRLSGLLGEGGFGVVYLAEQSEPVRRRVALKIIKPGMDTKAVIARFEAERQALALMDHPNVARVFDASSTEQGRPYFVMEHVPGVPITEHCDRHKLNIEQRLDLFMQVCDAVQHAHQKGVIHRDIKPTNILVVPEGTEARRHEGMERATGVPKVIDFGVAKALSQPLTERTIFTAQGQLIGTPEYMSPEQAEMTAQDVDTRSDIYSLGVLLYELLTGTLPFDRETLRRAALGEIQRIIREVEPAKPSTKLSSLQHVAAGGSPAVPSEPEAQARVDRAPESESLAGASGSVAQIARSRRSDARTLVRTLRGDLDWITMKALEKDRTRRYGTASDLAADIQRHLRHEPVVAGPPSAAYRIRKFVRRNQGFVTGAAAVLTVLVAGIAVSTSQALRARRAERRVHELLGETERARDLAEERRAEVEQQRAEAVRQGTIAQAVTAFLTDDMLASADPDRATEGEITLRDALDEAARKVAVSFTEQPEVEAAVRDTIGRTYQALGLYEAAETHLESALRIRARVLGQDGIKTLISMNNLAALYLQQKRLAEAEDLYRRAVEAHRRAGFDEHPEALTAMNGLAAALAERGKLVEAEGLYDKVLQLRRRLLGEDHPSTLITLSNVATLYLDQGKLPEAERFLRESLEGHRRVLGPEHSKTLIVENNFAAVLSEQGKASEAEAHYRNVLAVRRRVLGDEHPDTLVSISNLGAVLRGGGQLREAEALHREALAGRRRVLGEEHPDTLLSLGKLARCLHDLGRLAEAAQLHRECLELRRRVLGDEHPDTLASMDSLGVVLIDLDRPEEGEPLLREGLRVRRRLLGDEHPDTLNSMSNLAFFLHSRGRFEEAETMARDTLEIQRHVLGEEHDKTLISMNNLAAMLAKLGKLEEAEQLHAEAVAGAKRSLPEGHRHTGLFLHGQGKCLTKLERYADAEVALLEAHGILEAAFGPQHERTIGAAKALVQLYDAWGKPEKAAEWRRKLPTTQPARAETQPAISTTQNASLDE